MRSNFDEWRDYLVSVVSSTDDVVMTDAEESVSDGARKKRETL